MSYRYLFADATTGEKFIVRARDVAAAIHFVENNRSGVFDCLAQYHDKEPLGEPLATWPPGEL